MVFTAVLMFTFAATSQTTISVQILDPMDDCEEVREVIDPTDVLGFMDHGSSDLELCTEDNLQYVGLIFRDVQIPVGATITNAYVQFQCDDLNDEAITLEIYGAAEATVPAPFTEDLFGVSSHPSTTATVSWTPPAWATEGEAGPDQATPDISAIIAEIIAIDGWAPGNNIMIVVTDDEPQKIHREAESADGDATGAATLVVTYEEGAPAGTTISVQVSDPDDDAEEGLDPDPDGNLPLGGVELHSGDLEMCTEAENYRQIVGIIFRDIQIPIGANITNAYVQFVCDDTNDEDITVDIWGANEANVTAPFTDEAYALSSHPKTTTKVEWTPVPWLTVGENGVDQQTPDISAIITEIIAIPGWAPGNNIMIMVTDEDNPVKSHRQAVTYDEDPTKAAILNVTFTEGGGTGVNSVRSEFSSLIYPNPTEGKLYITNPSTDKFSYQIFTINGKLVESRHNITGSATEVDLSHLVKGMYFIGVRTTEKSETHKVILK
jgi:hypothetical protein